MKTGIVASSFDLLHAGHVMMLREAKSKCDHLIAALQTYPIDIRILGEEYRDKDFTGREICKRRGIQLYFNRRDHRFSSSDLRKRVAKTEKDG